jgi:uncharacterized protein YukE
MSQAIADPDDIERFAQHLQYFNDQLRQNISQLDGAFGNLGDTWQDQQYQQFAEEYTQTKQMVEHFLETADQFIPFLGHQVAVLREYLNRTR